MFLPFCRIHAVGASMSTCVVATEHMIESVVAATLADAEELRRHEHLSLHEHMIESALHEHFSVVCFTLADAEELRRHEATMKPPRSLHKLAIYTHNATSTGGNVNVGFVYPGFATEQTMRQ